MSEKKLHIEDEPNATDQWWRTALVVFIAFGFGMTFLYYSLSGFSWQPKYLIFAIFFNGFVSNLAFFGHWMMYYQLEKWFDWKDKVTLTSVLYALGSLVVSTIMYFIFTFGWDFLLGRSWEYAVNDLSVEGWWNVVTISLFVTVFMASRGFYKAAIKSQQEAADAHEARLTAEYQALKNQIDPHNLFNSLNILNSLVYEDPDLASDFIQQLSHTFRYSLENRDKELVPLTDELEAVHAYLYIMQTRFQEAMESDIKIPDPQAWALPPLSMQIVLENIFKHNEASRFKPLNIQIWTEAGYLVIRNTLAPRPNPGYSSGIGLETLRKRFAYLTTQPLIVENKGQHFTVRMPLVAHHNKARSFKVSGLNK